MRILICHGYLLRGTGSNMYVQSLTRALCGLGHQVLLYSQESDPTLDFVSTFMREGADEGAEIVWDKETDYPGNCMAFQADIGELLPVYVLDSYPWFTVKEFTTLTDGELERYVAHNRRALARLLAQFVPDAVLVNHAVMLPEIMRPVAREAGVAYNVVIHGSAIEYAVKRDARYLEYGASGLSGASTVFVPSEHTRKQVLEVFSDRVEGLDGRISFIPPGVDTGLFAPPELPLEDSLDLMRQEARRRTETVTVGRFVRDGEDGEADVGPGAEIALKIERINAAHPDWLPDEEGLEALVSGARPRGKLMVFLGKLLETKGAHCILPAVPLVLERKPDTAFVIVGFGELRGMLQLMLDALGRGDLDALEELCEFGNQAYSLMKGAFDPVVEFIAQLRAAGMADRYMGLCRRLDLGRAVLFTGHLAPEEHRHLLGHASALLAPSLAPEAFGLVVTEAMAAGTVPIACAHSGLATALEPMRETWGADAGRLTLDRDGLVIDIAGACDFVLGSEDAVLEEKGTAMRNAVKKRFSWDAVARRMVERMGENA